MFKVSIPVITNKELLKRYNLLKPVVRFDDKLYWMRDFTLYELRNKNFLSKDDIKTEVKEGELKALEGFDFLCIHSFSFGCFFHPTICEVLAQVDPILWGSAQAFEIIKTPIKPKDSPTINYNLEAYIYNAGYHVSAVRLYTNIF